MSRAVVTSRGSGRNYHKRGADSYSAIVAVNNINTNVLTNLDGTLVFGRGDATSSGARNVMLYITAKNRFGSASALARFDVKVNITIGDNTIVLDGAITYDSQLDLCYVDVSDIVDEDLRTLGVQQFLSGFETDRNGNAIIWGDAIITDASTGDILFIVNISTSEDMATFRESYGFVQASSDIQQSSALKYETPNGTVGDVNDIVSKLLQMPSVQKHLDKQQKEQDKKDKKQTKLLDVQRKEQEKLTEKQRKQQERLINIKKATKLFGGADMSMSFNASDTAISSPDFNSSGGFSFVPRDGTVSGTSSPVISSPSAQSLNLVSSPAIGNPLLALKIPAVTLSASANTLA